jgi:oligopeptide/dipeptide ABC transporter ATP-binding protein
MDETRLLSIANLTIRFATDGGELTAVDGIDLDLAPGESLGLVGESGCGKSVTAFSIIGLLPEHGCRVSSGQLVFAGQELGGASAETLRDLRGRRIGVVFQDALSSLDPVFTVGYQLGEALLAHARLERDEVRRRSVEMLGLVGIDSPENRLADYPHQLSGGMRQRVMLAIALVNNPDLLIADEPTTALDVTIQAQVLRLLRSLQRERHMAMLFITHDLGVVAEVADRVAVMYAGRIIEQAPTAALLGSPLHPYTRGLLASVPDLETKAARLVTIPGRVPTLAESAGLSGCRFAPRCPLAVPRCSERPPMLEAHGVDRLVACYRAGEGA